MGQGATIDAHNQVVICGKRRHGGGVGAVTLVNAVWNIQRRIAPLTAQPVQKQCRRGAAIDIIIGENGNALARRRGIDQTLGGDGHVAQA